MEKFAFEAEVAEAAGDAPARTITLERLSRTLLLVLVFLLPVFFIPSVTFPFAGGKALLLFLVTLGAFALFLIARLKDGLFALPRTLMTPALGIAVAVFALSGVLSGSAAVSFIGQGFEVGTVLSFFAGALLVFLLPLLFRGKEQIFGGYLSFLAAFFLLAFFHLLRLIFGPDLFAMDVLRDATANTVGGWNDLGVFFGVGALLSLITIEFLALNRLFRALVYLALILSLFFLAVVNFPTIWTTLGLFSLVLLVYLISFQPAHVAVGAERTDDAPAANAPSLRRIPIPSLLVLLVSVVFMLAGGTLGREIASVFNISQFEARPSWQATFDVARRTLIADPLLGAGPNRFVRSWLQFKPLGINQTIFWNVDFNYGVGLIPTFLATSGILGLLAWATFLLLFLYSGFQAILSTRSNSFSQYLVTSSFLVSLFLWLFCFLYVPSMTIFALAFIFTGFFLAALVAEGTVPVKTVSFIDDPRAGFVSVLVLILLLVGSVTLGYAVVQRYVASVYFQKGVLAANKEGAVDRAEGLIAKAAALAPTDLYYRFLTEITLARMNTLLSQSPGAASAESVRSGFQALLGAALGNARQAVALNSENYENLMELGRVYEAVVPLRIEGAYESAKATYEQALSLNPKSPAILLTLARLEITKGDNAKAREGIARALAEKGNYTEAIFLLSQLEAREGNIKAAIQSAEAASVIAPTDATVFFQLGLLRFNDRDFRGAVGALERSVALNPAYANAKYFLGLSYDKLGRGADAVRQFSDLKTTNPGNKEIDLVLRNLKAGRPPFAEATPPIDDRPEKRPKLPVKEKSVKAVQAEE